MSDVIRNLYAYLQERVNIQLSDKFINVISSDTVTNWNNTTRRTRREIYYDSCEGSDEDDATEESLLRRFLFLRFL